MSGRLGTQRRISRFHILYRTGRESGSQWHVDFIHIHTYTYTKIRNIGKRPRICLSARLNTINHFTDFSKITQYDISPHSRALSFHLSRLPFIINRKLRIITYSVNVLGQNHICLWRRTRALGTPKRCCQRCTWRWDGALWFIAWYHKVESLTAARTRLMFFCSGYSFLVSLYLAVVWFNWVILGVWIMDLSLEFHVFKSHSLRFYIPFFLLFYMLWLKGCNSGVWFFSSPCFLVSAFFQLSHPPPLVYLSVNYSLCYQIVCTYVTFFIHWHLMRSITLECLATLVAIDGLVNTKS